MRIQASPARARQGFHPPEVTDRDIEVVGQQFKLREAWHSIAVFPGFDHTRIDPQQPCTIFEGAGGMDARITQQHPHHPAAQPIRLLMVEGLLLG